MLTPKACSECLQDTLKMGLSPAHRSLAVMGLNQWGGRNSGEQTILCTSLDQNQARVSIWRGGAAMGDAY